ncbi:MAG: GDSL-type esterase/lipase family protein [Caldimonas sp.]
MKSRRVLFYGALLAAPVVAASAHVAWHLWRSLQLVRRSEPLQARPARPVHRLLVVGDSTGVGTGASSPKASLAGLIAAAHPQLAVVNRSADGATFAEIAAQLDGSDRFDAVLILGGGNDVIRLTGASKLRSDIDRAVTRARALSDTVVLMPAGNVGNAPFFFWPWSALATRRARALQATARAVAAARGATFVSLFKEHRDDPFAREPDRLNASDGLHPSDAGYRLWLTELNAQSDLDSRLGRPA